MGARRGEGGKVIDHFYGQTGQTWTDKKQGGRGEGGEILENSIRGFDRFYVCEEGGRKIWAGRAGGERLSIAAEGGSKK